MFHNVDSRQYLEPKYQNKNIIDGQAKLKNDANLETLQVTKQNVLIAINNN